MKTFSVSNTSQSCGRHPSAPPLLNSKANVLVPTVKQDQDDRSGKLFLLHFFFGWTLYYGTDWYENITFLFAWLQCHFLGLNIIFTSGAAMIMLTWYFAYQLTGCWMQ